MRDYYRRTLLDRWEDLAFVSRVARDLYFFCMTGPNSTAYGIAHVHRLRLRRDLQLTDRQIDAALVELAEAGVVQFEEEPPKWFVVADLDLARSIAPKDPNNKIAMSKRCHHVPRGATVSQWELAVGLGAQLPESTGFRGASPSQALAKPSPSKKENKNKNENQNEKVNTVARQPAADKGPHRRAWAAWLKHMGSDDRSAQHRSGSHLPASKELRKVLSAFVNSDRDRDFDAYFAYLASVDPWSWYDGTFRPTIEWATRPATRNKVAAESYQAPRKPEEQKPPHAAKHEGSWQCTRGIWRTKEGYPIDQWGKPDYGARDRGVRPTGQQQSVDEWREQLLARVALKGGENG